MAHFIKIPSYQDPRGSLSVIEKIIPFEIKRVYYIYGVPKPDIVRAGHRHKKTIQALICITGSCVISNNNGNIKEKFILDTPDKCLILKPEDWHTMDSFTKDAVLLVLASEFYDRNEYIDEGYL